MLPPGARGTISYIAPAGEYTVNDEVIEIEFQVRTGVWDGVERRVLGCSRTTRLVLRVCSCLLGKLWVARFLCIAETTLHLEGEWHGTMQSMWSWHLHHGAACKPVIRCMLAGVHRHRSSREWHFKFKGIERQQ
jgi:hypothetical protein